MLYILYKIINASACNLNFSEWKKNTFAASLESKREYSDNFSFMCFDYATESTKLKGSNAKIINSRFLEFSNNFTDIDDDEVQ